MIFDQVLTNELKGQGYCPYCLRCSGLVRMVQVSPHNWKCVRCPAKADCRTWFTIVKDKMVFVMEDGEQLDKSLLPADVQAELGELTFSAIGTPCTELLGEAFAICHPRDEQHLARCEECRFFWESYPLFRAYVTR